MNRVHNTIFHLNDRMSVLHIAVVGRIPVVFRYDDFSQYNSLPGQMLIAYGWELILISCILVHVHGFSSVPTFNSS